MAKEIKVILTKTVANLGHSGDVVEVKLGYARNYLIPQGLAFAWSKGAARQIEDMRRARLAKDVATRQEAVETKAAIEGSTVEIAVKVSESGKLFGGVSNDAIAAALADKATVDPKAITVESIKTTGDFAATVQLHPEIVANFTVKVVAEAE
ncbi:50S ribosomal protein L9 [Bifidobacterium vespertilionis]|uniref:50S ribosomal protein L9 n=1 Tax=Bifidobacterium vespertilionis TaxID=2562524 RepID=UPI001BDD5A66|nr:50S ribosomal protein L9 [Bifidobacterium vespertilionis]MBT1180334.1 50S ribosomal protein L9 [Bifidobacterium vespertilionis]